MEHIPTYPTKVTPCFLVLVSANLPHRGRYLQSLSLLSFLSNISSPCSFLRVSYKLYFAFINFCSYHPESYPSPGLSVKVFGRKKIG